MKSLLIVLLALGLWPAILASADAAVSQRIQSLSLRLEQSPDIQALHMQRALAYMEDNQPELALSDIRKAESLGEAVAAAYAHGVLLYREQEYVDARLYFDRYLKAYPEHWGARNYRARLLRNIGQNPQALADYEVLMGLNDNLDPGYYIAIARLLAGQPERGVDEALTLLDNRMAQIGTISTLQRYAIELERQRGNYDSAIARLANLDAKLRATPQWQLEVAELLLEAGRTQEALPYLLVAQEQLQIGRPTAVNLALLKEVNQLLEAVAKAVRQVRNESSEDGR